MSSTFDVPYHEIQSEQPWEVLHAEAGVIRDAADQTKSGTQRDREMVQSWKASVESNKLFMSSNSPNTVNNMGSSSSNTTVQMQKRQRNENYNM